MRRPLGFVALWYGGGLLLGEFFQPPLRLLFCAAITFAAAALFLSRIRLVLIPPLLALTGWTNFICHTAVLSPADLRAVLGEAPRETTVRGALASSPETKAYRKNGQERFRTRAAFRVTACRMEAAWQPATGMIIVTMRDRLPPEFFSGQETLISGIIAPPAGPVADGLFDYRTWLRRQGIYYQLEVGSPADWRLLSTNTVPPLGDRFRAWSKQTLARGLPVVDDALQLTWAMTLGAKNALPGEVYQPFMESGTMHIFAISGLHIALLSGILIRLLRLFRLSRPACGLLLVPLLWFYAGATGWQPSAIRSTVMMTVVIAGWSLKRPGDLLNSLAAAAFIILLWDPQQLFQAGFQLSFFVVLSIALFLPPLERLLDRWLQPDPFLPQSLWSPWRRQLERPLRAAGIGIATSAAAWLGSWPLTAYYFHLFSPVTLLANVVVLPLSGAALAANVGSLICGAWCPGAAELFNHSGWLWMSLMMEASRQAAALPGAFIYVRAPALMDFFVYYGALIGVLSGFAFAPQRRFWSSLTAVGLAAVYCFRWCAADHPQLTVLPLNGGSAIYCHPGGRQPDLLVDCGSSNSVEFVVKPFLQARGINRLPTVALTHGDARQVGGLGLLHEELPVGFVATSPAAFRSPVYRRVVSRWAIDSGRRRVLNRGDPVGGWIMLHPDASDSFAEADDSAMVLFGTCAGVRVLLLSDLGRRGQDVLLERHSGLRADIVIAGLPAASEPLCDALLDALQPKLIVVADSEFPATRRASPRLCARLGRRGIPVWYTRETGAVTFEFRRGSWAARAGVGGWKIRG